jgi:hypothetical protein
MMPRNPRVLQAIAFVLAFIVLLAGSYVVDFKRHEDYAAQCKAEIEERFSETSLRRGAWVMDRDTVSSHVGINPRTLPSVQEQERWSK